MRNKKKTGGKKEADFDSFENPVAEEPATTSFESETKLSPTALSSTSRKSSDDVATVRNLPTPEVKNLSPPGPLGTHDLIDDCENDDILGQGVEDDQSFKVELEEKGQYGRSGLIYLLFQTTTLVLLPCYVTFFVLAAWACYEVTNPISLAGTVISFIIPWLLYYGFRCARDNKMEQLRCYSFLLLLAVCLQISLCLVILLDDCGSMPSCVYGAMTDDYLINIADAARSICSNVASVDSTLLPYREICACLSGADGSMDGSWFKDNNLLTQYLAAALDRDEQTSLKEDITCMANAMANADVTPTHVKRVLLSTLFVELVLAYLAFQMMVDLDEKAAKKANKQKGGPRVGTLRGVIVGAQDLRSGLERIPKSKRANNHSSRYAVLEVNNPILANKEHRKQKFKTSEIEDDREPAWNMAFDQVALYRDTQKFEVKVYDVVKKGKKDQHVLIGTAGTYSKHHAPSGVRMNYEKGTLTDLDFTMNGHGTIWLQLFDEDGKAAKKKTAGQVEMKLEFAPAQALIRSTSAIITNTWYFEMSVLLMCLLAMISLALQSPASPPSPTLYAVLRIVDIFVATELTLEVLMETEVQISNGEKQLFLQKGFILKLFILTCNWLQILFPLALARETATLQQTHNGASVILGKLISVGRVLRIVRPIRTFRLIKNVDIIVQVLTESVPLFLTVQLLLVFLLAIFSLVGVSSFGGALQYECIAEETLAANDGDCPEERQAFAELMGVECPLPCPTSLKCHAQDGMQHCAPLATPRVVGYDPFGFRNMDNFWRGMMSTFVQTTGDGGMHTIPLALNEADAIGVGRSWILSLAVSMILHLVSLNLFLAVCCSAYSDVAERAHEINEQMQRLKDAVAEEEIKQETEQQRAERLALLAAEKEAAKTNHQLLQEKSWGAKTSRCPRLRNGILAAIQSEMFGSATTFVIVGNTITMAIVHKDMDKELEDTLVLFELFFLICYVLEAFCKLFGSGSHLYFRSLENKFDLFVILSSLFGVIATFFKDQVQSVVGSTINLNSVQSFRAVRLLRALQIVRLLHRQKALIMVMKTIFQAWRPLLLHSIFCCFSMSVFSIVGMHVFGGSLRPEECLAEVCTIEDYDRLLPENFENFQTGFLTVFEMTVGEEWSHSMYWYMHHAGHRGLGYPTFIVELFFVMMYIWMNGILFSLYVAMLLENFSIPEEDKYPLQKTMYDRQRKKAMIQMRKLKRSLLTQTVNASNKKGYVERGDGLVVHQLRHAGNGLEVEDSSSKSLYLFGLNSRFRLTCAQVQEHKLFKRIITTLIAFSCISLAAEGRGEGGSGWVQENMIYPLGYSLFDWLNLAVLFAFVLEGTLKCVIHGFIFKSGPTNPYLKSRMNRVDFFIIVLCSASYVPFIPIAGPWARALRLGRVISPMMNLTKSPQIALVLLSFVRAAPDTAVVLLPLILMGVVFSIVGVASFSGKLAYCAPLRDPLQETVTLLVDGELIDITEEVCLNQTHYDWVSPQLSFDSSLKGLATLLVAITDGSHGYMMAFYEAAGTVSTGYWVGFHLVFTCFFLNLFLGVLTASFEKSSGSALMTLGEKQWQASIRMIENFATQRGADVEDVVPSQKSRCCRRQIPSWWLFIRKICYTLATNEYLEGLFRNVIAANTLTLASDMYPINPVHQAIVQNLNALFLSICTFEVVIKMIGFGPRFFFNDGWLVSDLILVSSSLFLLLSGGQSGVEALRVMRVFRIIVLGSRIPALVALVDIVVACMKASFAVILLTALAVYLYSIVGMNMFGSLPTDDVFERFDIPQDHPGCDTDEDKLCRWAEIRKSDNLMSIVCPSCSAYSDYTNFNDFTHSFRLLMQLAFGQGIGGFVADLESLGAEFWTAFAYFASFYMITVWISMNLLIVTVLSNFDAANTSTFSHNKIELIDLEGFAHTWAALTIGVHRNSHIAHTNDDLVDNLKTKLHEENNPEYETVASAVFEDGQFGGAGQLAVRIESLEGIQTESSRPYCAITTFGSDYKGEETRLTRTVNTNDGIARFKPMLDARRNMRAALGLALPVPDTVDEDTFDAAAGETVLFHITSYHTHLCIQVRDAFQFTDHLLGAVCLPFEEILGHDGTRSCPLAIKEMTHGSNKCSHVLELWTSDDGEVKAVPAGEKDRWHRYEEAEDVESESDGGDSDVEPDVVLPEADPDDEIEDDEKKEMTKHEKREAKRQAKAHKKEEKAAKKAAKKAKKAQKRAASGKRSWIQRLKFWEKTEFRQPVDDGDEQYEDENTVPVDPWVQLNPYDESKGWKKTSLKLSLAFEFQEQVLTVPTTSWLKDHAVRFSHMHNTCGCAGWMELSEGFKPFKRRFCFIQDEPNPRFGFYRNAKNIDDLERMSMQGKIDTHFIEGKHMLVLCEGHDNKIHQRKNQRKRNFSIECEEEIVDGGKEEARVGILNGVITSASGLQQEQGAAKAVQLCKLVRFLADDEDGAGEEAAELKQDDDDTDAQIDAPQADLFEIVDYDDQERIEPTRYMACHRTAYHLGCEKDQQQIGILHKGTVVEITHTRVADNVLHLRCSAGWLRATCDRRNNTFLIAENSKTLHYKTLKGCDINADVAVSSNKIGRVKKHSVVEVFESQIDDNTGAMRFKIQTGAGLDSPFGWISELDLDEEATPDPYCIMETVPNLPAGVAELATPPESSESKRGAKRREKQNSGENESPAASESELPRSDSIGDFSDKQLKKTTKRLMSNASQKVTTKVVENDLSPLWQTKFKFSVFASCTKVKFTVLDEGPDTVLGTAEFSLGSAGVPGPTVNTTTQAGIDLARDKLTTVEVPLFDAAGKAAGTISIELAYEEIVTREVLLEKQLQSTSNGGNLVAAMLKRQTKAAVYRFQCPTLDHQRQWLSVLRWIACGALTEEVPRSLDLPSVMLAPAAAQRAESDISLVDLPFIRIPSLLHGLYRRRVMGSHKPTLRRVAYTVFQLETHAWRSDSASIQKKDKRKVGYSDADGQFLVMLRGINFHKCLQRLLMLHYGKRLCLSYRQQVEEFEIETQHLALEVLQTFVAHWVFKTRARLKKTVGGIQWPWHSAWRKHPKLYFVACEAVCAQRIRTLKVLKIEVQRRSAPIEVNDSEVAASLVSGQQSSDSPKPTPEKHSQSTGLPCFKKTSEQASAVSSPNANTDINLDPVDATSESILQRRELIQQAFNQVDKNQTGELDEDGLRQVMTILTGAEPEPKDFQLMMHLLDQDKGGSVSMQEFIDTLEELEDGDDAVGLEDDDDDDLDGFGGEYGADPREQLMMALDD